MPAAAIPTWALITSAVAPAAASVAGSVMQSRAAGSAARTQVNAANHAADVQGRTADEALAFQREQARIAQEQAETDRRANYDQWAARERRLGSIGASLGYGNREIPAYVPNMPGQPSTGAPVSGSQPVPVGSGRTPAAAANGLPMSPGAALMVRPPSAPIPYLYRPKSAGAYLMARA